MKNLFVISILLNSFTLNLLPSSASGQCVSDFRNKLQALSSTGTKIKIKAGKNFTYRSYTMSIINGLGIDNHFQGTQILPNGKNFVFSGGDIHRKKGHLFVGEWNAEFSSAKVLKRITVGSKKFWHAGGLGGYQGIVAVPVEDYKDTRTGRIEFYDFSKDPTNPEHLDIDLIRDNAAAGAVTLSRLEDNRYIVAVYDAGALDFYVSNTTNLLDGFDYKNWVRMTGADVSVPEGARNDFGGSSVQLVKQCDGTFFLLDFNNTSKTPPIQNGINVVANYQLNFKFDGTTLSGISALKIQEKQFTCGNWCNFSAAADLIITPEGKPMLFSTAFFRNWFGTFVRSKVFQ